MVGKMITNQFLQIGLIEILQWRAHFYDVVSLLRAFLVDAWAIRCDNHIIDNIHTSSHVSYALL